MTVLRRCSPPVSAVTQSGATLAVVLGLLLVATLVLVGGVWVLNQQQRVAANEVDRSRANEAAEALLADARQDIVHPTWRALDAVQLPLRLGEYETLRLRIAAQSAFGCVEGICTPDDANSLTAQHWGGLESGNAFWATGARYGQFSGAADSSQASLLSQGRYWIEVLVAQTPANAAVSTVSPDPITPFVFRLTAVVLGQRAGTQAVLQSIVVPVPAS